MGIGELGERETEERSLASSATRFGELGGSGELGECEEW